jgi:hypothetical protein
MSIYVRIQDGQVAELFTAPDGFTIAECFDVAFSASQAAAMRCPPICTVGMPRRVSR